MAATMTMYGKLSGAALTSHVKRQFEVSRRAGEQIEQRKGHTLCPKCEEVYANVGNYRTFRWWLRITTCFHCGFDQTTGGVNLAPHAPRPESFRREGWYGPRAKEVKAETRRLVRVS